MRAPRRPRPSALVGLLLLTALASTPRGAHAQGDGLGGDGRVRVRSEASGRVLERLQAGRWVPVWASPPRDEDGERGAELRWAATRDSAMPRALRFGWMTEERLCGQGLRWLNPQTYDPQQQRFLPLGAWAPAPVTSVSASAPPAAARAALPLAPVVRWGPAAGGKKHPLGDGDATTEWGGALASADRVATAHVSAAGRLRAVRLMLGRRAPREAWLFFEGASYRVEIPAAGAREVRVELPGPPLSACLSLVLPAGDAGALAGLDLETEEDLAADPVPVFQAALEAGGDREAGARERLQGSGDPGLQIVRQLRPTTAATARRWARSLVATEAADASVALLETFGRSPAGQRGAYAEAARALGPPFFSALGAAASGPDAAALVPVLAALERQAWSPQDCEQGLVGALRPLLLPESALDLLWWGLKLTRSAQCRALEPEVLALVTHEDEQTRRAALETLGGLLPPSASPSGCLALQAALRSLGDDPSPDVRQQAWILLARSFAATAGRACGPGTDAGDLRALASAALERERWPELRRWQWLALWALEPEAGRTEWLRRGLASDHGEIRRQALLLAQERGAGAALSAEVAALAADERRPLEERREAVALLLASGPSGDRALRELLQRLAAKDPEDPLIPDLERALDPTPALPASRGRATGAQPLD